MPLGAKWARRYRREEIARRGGVCEECKRWGKPKHLHFAHVKPTEVRGTGRGLIRRMLDVRRHPDAYRLLCRWCHIRLDHAAAYVNVPRWSEFGGQEREGE